MLDKLKLFNKEKQQNAVNAAAVAAAAANKTQIQSKRTSSSSGFSSARSERSDSSLSLNDGHGSQLKPPGVSVSMQKSQQKHNTKQSKLLAAQQKKDLSKSSVKLDKKEKSPARSLHKEELQSGNESRSSTMGRGSGKSSLARGPAEKTSSKSSLHSKSDSKCSLKSQPHGQSQQQLHSPGGGTALPKPIAAIKGTSKLPQPGAAPGELFKRETSDISLEQHQQQQQSVAAAGPAPQMQHIFKALPATPPPPYYANAPVTPATPPPVSGYLSEPSTPGSAIYGSAGSRLPPPKAATLSAPRKLEYNARPHILGSPPPRIPLAPRGPAHSSAPNTPTASPSKFHTIPSKIVGTIYESKEEQSSSSATASSSSAVLPMRPLLRGYNSHVTLPTRGARGGQPHQHHQHHPHQSYLDFCESDLGQGYCSDGDALRVGSSAASSRFHDIDNGYLSEGSSGHATGGVAHGKHFLSMMRARTQLPTTIEER